MTAILLAAETTQLLNALVSAGTRTDFAAGDVLCSEGDLSDQAFVVVAGRIDATVAGHQAAIQVATHEPGAIIGEVTTLIGGSRTATLSAAELSTVAVVDRSVLSAIFEKHSNAAHEIIRQARERTDRTRVAAMLSNELQAEDSSTVAAIADRVTWCSLVAGDVLFRHGDPADAAYLVVSGRLALSEVAGTSSGKTAPIEVGRGAIVGEFGLLESRGRSATVTALRDTSLARLSGDDFRTLTSEHVGLAMGLVRRIIDRHGNEYSAKGSARSFALAITANLGSDERNEIIRTMQQTLVACGRTRILDADRIDDMLLQPGIADIASGSFGEVRLAELLHQSETDFDHVMLDVGSRGGEPDDLRANWTRRALQHADQVVIITSPTPTAAEDVRVKQLLATTPKHLARWIAVLHPHTTERPTGGRRMREHYGVDDLLHLRRGSESDLARLARLAAGRGVGLALSGGGARGNAHIGVFRALTEQGVPVDRLVGASMGSIVAGMIGQGLSPDGVLEAMKLGSGKLLDYTLPIVSLVKGRRIVNVLENQFDSWEFEDLWIPMACTSTNMTTAQSMIHREGSVAWAIRASVSIPGVLPPVVDGDHLLADGGILDNLPAGLLADDPSIGTIIASDVAPPLGPRAKGDYGLSVSGWAAARRKVLPRRLQRGRSGDSPKLPGVGGTLMRAMLIGSSRTRDEHLASGAIDLYLDLDLRSVSLLDFAQVDSANELGYADANDRVAAWLAARGGSVWGNQFHDDVARPLSHLQSQDV
jgi:predicted acylesterase/phospholipase RssA/CRP-like cAMP-binding protein